MPDIAVIGAGISGLTAAFLLSARHQVTLIEANDYLGGHTHTHDVVVDGSPVRVDTGFIVYNERTYPNFIALLDQLGCQGKKTEMSFSVSNPETGLEYNGPLTCASCTLMIWVNTTQKHCVAGALAS